MATVSALLDRVDKGQVYAITKRRRRIGELRPDALGTSLQFGGGSGRITIRADFDAGIPHVAESLSTTLVSRGGDARPLAAAVVVVLALTFQAVLDASLAAEIDGVPQHPHRIIEVLVQV